MTESPQVDRLTDITYLSPALSVSMADSWYEIATLDHFWVRRRWEVAQRLLGSALQPGKRVADVGCGNGLLQKQIADVHGIAVDGFDLNIIALRQNICMGGRLYCYDVTQRLPSVKAAYDVVFLCDVLEHITDENEFLDGIAWMLRPDGIVLINVPALPALYSRYDRAAGHCRRYSRAMLLSAGMKHGLGVLRWTYWGLPLLPLLLARCCVLAFGSAESSIDRGFNSKSRLMNALLHLLSRQELIPQHALGTSAMAVLQKTRVD